MLSAIGVSRDHGELDGPDLGPGMSGRTMDEQLIKFLADVHSIEVQALAQMRRAPDIAGDPALARAFSEHLEETQEHERLVREVLTQRGADPSALKDLAGRIGGWAMIVFARINPDTPGKLTAHAFSYEHMEVAAYTLLERAAERAGDPAVAQLARRIASEEKTMARRLAATFDEAVDASLCHTATSDLGGQVVAYLQDAHAIETQALQFLKLAPGIAGAEPLAKALRAHASETEVHRGLVEERLKAHGARPSRFQDTALRIGGLNLAGFFAAQPDTPAKLAGFAFAFEHLEIAAYELLCRVADRAADSATVATAERIAGEERTAADRIASTWDAVMDTALQNTGIVR
jgi:ferritin-like metal-binding protein YciE